MLSIGRILKSYGTDGGLLVSSDVDLETLEKKEPVFIEYDGLQVPFFIVDCTPKGNRYILHLTDISNLEEADEVVGRQIFADVEQEPDSPDFIGWTVYDIGGGAYAAGAAEAGAARGAGATPAGVAGAGAAQAAGAGAAAPAGITADSAPRRLGTVTGDEPIPGNYCIYVGDIMIPLHEDFIVSADPARRELVLDLPAGLY
ncbi:MAG: hypothetical protein K6F58_06045 [Bacteroidales bacterium]|nr:hypothetical protein [Bacteroidales bacterium]